MIKNKVLAKITLFPHIFKKGADKNDRPFFATDVVLFRE